MILVFLTLLWVQGCLAQPPRRTDYCIQYFGRIGAMLNVPDSVPKKNYNSTVICPRSWIFPDTIGATLQLCPPEETSYWFNASDGLAMDVTLELGRMGTRRLPIDHMRFDNVLITNGSVPGPFTNNGTPAVIKQDAKKSNTERYPHYWVLNGSEKAFISLPDANKVTPTEGVYFDCNNIPDNSHYCGTSEDRNGLNGCWSSQFFPWDMKSLLNFSINFHTEGATAEIWVQPNSSSDGNGFGSSGCARVYMEFKGDNVIPSVTDIDFWKNTAYRYESYAANRNRNIGLEPDDQGFPIFYNETKTGEMYFTRNQTYSVESVACATKEPSQLCILIVATGVSLLVGGWCF